LVLAVGAGGTNAVCAGDAARCGDVTCSFMEVDDVTALVVVAAVIGPFDDDACDPFACAVVAGVVEGGGREVEVNAGGTVEKADEEIEKEEEEEGAREEEEKGVGGGMKGVVAVVEEMLPRN